MQCRYGTGEAATWITGVQYQEDCGPLVVQGSAQVQVEALIRATTPFLAGRGNKAVRLPVPVVLQFADWMSAVRFCHEAFWDLPLDGELLFREQYGTDLIDITYPKAALENIQLQRRAVSVTVLHQFVVTGPPTFTTAGDAPLRILTESGEPITTES